MSKRKKPENHRVRIESKIMRVLGKSTYKPMRQEDLLKSLRLKDNEHTIAKQVIGDLIRNGTLVVKKKRLGLPEKAYETHVSGIIHIHPRGFAFVTPDNPEECKQTIFVPARFTEDAVQGDHVEVSLSGAPRKPERGPEGRVVQVLARGHTHFAGVLKATSNRSNFELFSPLLGQGKQVIVVASKDQKLEDGMRVVTEVTDWKDRKFGVRAKVTEILGSMNDPLIDIDCALKEFELQSTFPEEAILQAKAFGTEVSKKDCKERTDFTKDEVFTIDPETARDFDDALAVTKTKKGYHLAVHIADVSHYVRPGTILDAIASTRCNSVYFPGRCVPMIPHELSNELCSLKEGVKRLTASVLMEFDQDGTLLDYTITRGVIKSRKRFTYEQAKEVLDGKLKSKHKKALVLMTELCEKLKAKRRGRGSVDLALPETVMQLDDRGIPCAFKVVEYDITHQLVEEFMLKANEVVATHLHEQGKDSIYRVHQTPTLEDQEDFFQLARLLGFNLPPEPAVTDIQAVFKKAKDTPYAQQLSITFIRSMKLAMYSPDNVGHYGLALQYYTHFTSPIRRYPDLIIHRLLFDDEAPQALNTLSMSCSDAERNAARAEQRVIQLKKLRYLSEAEDDTVFNATITKIFPIGFTFEVDVFGLEGVIFVADLPHYYHFNQERALHQTEDGTRRFRLGDKLQVQVADISLTLAEVKWNLLS